MKSDAGRLERVLERTRREVAPELRSELVREVAIAAARNQFDDDRVPVRSELRRLIEIEVELLKTQPREEPRTDDS